MTDNTEHQTPTSSSAVDEQLPPAEPRLMAPGEGETMHVLDETATFKVAGGDVGGAFSLVEVQTPPGGGAPAHLHDHADEVLYVLEGSYQLQVGDRHAEFGPGACAVVPRGTVHGYVNRGDEPGRLLSISTPAASPERIFVELAALLTTGTSASPELSSALGQVAERRGVRLSGGFPMMELPPE